MLCYIFNKCTTKGVTPPPGPPHLVHQLSALFHTANDDKVFVLKLPLHSINIFSYRPILQQPAGVQSYNICELGEMFWWNGRGDASAPVWLVHGSFKFSVATVNSNVIEEILIGAPHLCIFVTVRWLMASEPTPFMRTHRQKVIGHGSSVDLGPETGNGRNGPPRREQKWGKASWKQRGTGAKNKQRSEKPNAAVWFRFEPSVLCHVGETSHTNWCTALPSASPLSFLSPLPRLSLQNSCAASVFNLLSGLLLFSVLILLDCLLPDLHLLLLLLLIPVYLSHDCHEPQDKFSKIPSVFR